MPGHPLDPRAEGPNVLIRDGATLVRSAADILEHMSAFTGGNTYNLRDSGAASYRAPMAEKDAPDTDNARDEVLNTLSHTPVAIDEIVRDSGLGVPAVMTALLELELAGRVRRLPGNRVSLSE